MKIAQLRNHPFLLLVLKDGESEARYRVLLQSRLG